MSEDIIPFCEVPVGTIWSSLYYTDRIYMTTNNTEFYDEAICLKGPRQYERLACTHTGRIRVIKYPPHDDILEGT